MTTTAGTAPATERLYEVAAHITRMTDYGISLEAILSGQSPVPPEGAQLDVHFEGAISSSRLNGRISGVDYLSLRADGRIDLHIHAQITTEDGERIAFFGDGIASPEAGTAAFQLRENVRMLTASTAYSWLNRVQVWAVGAVDPTKGEINLRGYLA